MRTLITRTIYSDPWIGQVGLGIIASGAAVLPQEGWAALCAAVATATWIALWLGETPQGTRLASFLFGAVHGPLWWFVAYSAISATPAAFFPWWAMAGFALAEWIALLPAIRYLWERGGVGRGAGQ